MQKWQCNSKYNRLQGAGGHVFTNWLSPQCGAFNRYLLDVLKVKAPPLPGARGIVINDKFMCIDVFKCKLVYGSPVYTYGTLSHELYRMAILSYVHTDKLVQADEPYT